jgi:hypothetical protein
MTHDTGSKASSEALDSGFRESSSLRHSEQRALPCSGNMWKHLPPQGSYCTYGACSIISLAFSSANPAVGLEQEGWGLNPEAGDRSDKSVNSTARGTYQRCMFTVPSAVPSATSITCTFKLCNSMPISMASYHCDHMGLRKGKKQLCSLQLSYLQNP